MNKNIHAKFSFTFFITVLFCTICLSISAQTKTITRVAVVVEGTQTKIWLSDFPKKVSVVLYDSENNLLGIVTTNEFGAAYTSFNTTVYSTVTAKTLNGETAASNKAIKSNKDEVLSATADIANVNKA